MRLLLHICCGPCALVPLRLLAAEGHEMAAYFHNPNIHPVSEYIKRREGALRAVEPYPAVTVHFPPPELEYDLRAWIIEALHQEDTAPYGRCGHCWQSRMAWAARFAMAHGFEGFTTSLLYSRRQQHEGVKQAGEAASRATNLPFVYRDFRQNWQQGVEESKQRGIYRQQYCGCIFSEEERFRTTFIHTARSGS